MASVQAGAGAASAIGRIGNDDDQVATMTWMALKADGGEQTSSFKVKVPHGCSDLDEFRHVLKALEDIPQLKAVAPMSITFVLLQRPGLGQAWTMDRAVDSVESVPIVDGIKTLLLVNYPSSSEPHTAATTGTAATGLLHEQVVSFFRSLVDAQPQESPGLTVFSGVTNVNGNTTTVLVTPRIEAFWQECIRTLDEEDKRVCVVGTAGIGKSTTTLYLIRRLVLRGSTVVYLCREPDKQGFYRECVPVLDDNGKVIDLQFNTYAEKDGPGNITSLDNKKTYLVVDPGLTKDTCNPPLWMKARFIMNASPDAGHWGGNEFEKLHEQNFRGQGTFRYFPLPSRDEVLSARPYLKPEMTDEEFDENFRRYGPVPRHVFFASKDTESLQQTGLFELTDAHIDAFVSGAIATIDTKRSNQPRSSIMAYDSIAPFDASTKTVILISEVVQELVWNKFIELLWDKMLKAHDNSTIGHAWEVYARCRNLDQCSFMCRRESKKTGKGTMGNRDSAKQTFSACTKSRVVVDIVQAVRQGDDLVMYYSVDQKHPLIDYAFKHGNTFYMWNATIGDSHDAKPELVREMVQGLKLKPNERVHFGFTVPMDKLERFVTVPVDCSKDIEQCTAWVIGIPKPDNIHKRAGAPSTGNVPQKKSKP